MSDHDPSTAVPALRTDTLADSVLILLALTAVQRLVGFGRSVLFCRWLDVEQLGQWDMAFSFLVLAAPLAVLAIPGAFGRYVEHYRGNGQLRIFLRRTALVCAGTSLAALMGLLAARSWFSELVFGTPSQAPLVALLAASLAAVIAYNFLVELFTALRNVRLVAVMQLVNGLVFAVLGGCLLAWWRCTAASAVVAYGAACLVVAGGACLALRQTWQASPREPPPLAPRALWSKLMPFAGWMLVTNMLANLFEVADRYMIIHFSPGPTAEALGQVGNYYSSRVVPLLLVSVAVMLAAVITPHLSHDWETGRREQVAARLRLFLKLFGFAISAAGVAVLWAAPLLFGMAFRGKFAGGQAVLPWTLTYCAWFSMVLIAQNYLWCAEKARLASLALAIGLLVSVGLNLVLLPRLGLPGAVLATAAANLVALVLICTFNHRLGFRLDRGGRVVLALPLAIVLGPWLAPWVLIAVALEAAYSDRLLTPEEKQQILAGCRQYARRLRIDRLAPRIARLTPDR